MTGEIWAAVITQPRVTALPTNTSDIYPTLPEIAGVTPDNQPPLDVVNSLNGGDYPSE